MKNLMQEIHTIKEHVKEKWLVKKLLSQCFNKYLKHCLLLCSNHKYLLLNISRVVLIFTFGLVSIMTGDLKISIILLLSSIFCFCSAEIILRFLGKRHTNTFTYLAVIMLMVAQVSGAALNYVTSHYFIPLYNYSDTDNIRVYAGIDSDKKTEADVEYVLSKVQEARSSLKNEFRTDPPHISLIITKNTAEFAHFIKVNSPYTYDDSIDEYKNVPMVTRENTIVVNLDREIVDSNTYEDRFKYQLFYELSHIYYNNYSLNRNKFLKEGLARYFSKKYAGYDTLDRNYEDFLARWKKILEKEYRNTDKNNIPLILGDYTEDKAYDSPDIWEDSGNLAYNLLNWIEENYSSKVLLDMVSDLGKGMKSDEVFIRITGFDLKGAVWHSVMDDWYRKHEIRKALMKSIPNFYGDISKYSIYIGSESNRSSVPGEFNTDELISWLNINLPIQTEIIIKDFKDKKILQTQRGRIIYPENDLAKALY